MATHMLRRRSNLRRIGALRVLRERGDTEYLLSNPVMAARLRDAMRDLDEGKGIRLHSIADLERILEL